MTLLVLTLLVLTLLVLTVLDWPCSTDRMDIRVASDPQAAASFAADVIARRLRAAVRSRGAATIAVSGGTTPSLMLDDLAMADVPWDHVTVFQVDERVAPDGDPDRNATMLHRIERTRATFRPMPVTAADLVGAARRYAELLPPRLDIVHLGIGDDGHTASWPPGDPVVLATSTVAMSSPYRGRVRMTLTPRAVNAARSRLVLATGAAKAASIGRWLAGDRKLPIARIHRTRTLLVLDDDAASAIATDR